MNNKLSGSLSESTRRAIAANHRLFDSPELSQGAAARKFALMEASLIKAQDEAIQLNAMIDALEASTSWRITRPLRWLGRATQRARAEPPAPQPAPLPTSLDYRSWIDQIEAGSLAALIKPGPGHNSMCPQRIGLVIYGVKSDDLITIECPLGCSILVLEFDTGQSRSSPLPGSVLLKRVPMEITPAEIVQMAIELLDADMLGFIDQTVHLVPNALQLTASVLAQYPATALLFTDEDQLDGSKQRTNPFFKPGWNPELQRGRDLIGPFAFFRTDLVRNAEISSCLAWRYDLANQVIAACRPDQIHHIPAILYHRMTTQPGYDAALKAAATSQLRRDRRAGHVNPVHNHPDWQRIIYDLHHPAPYVSIIIPTRDRADLLRTCTEGVLHETEYPHLEVLIVDNGTVEPDALKLLEGLAEDPRVKVIRQPGPFNWSALNNAAAAESSGDIILLLNNDIAVLRPDWLTVLVGHAVQPGVGAVGAKLLYQDGRVQHAGLTTDHTGVPCHLFRYAAGDDVGAYGLLGLARDVWALTGACIALPRRVFFEVGGLNEALPVAYNDVDLCIRVTAHGYRLIWTPWSILEHRELASRQPDHLPARQKQVQEERNRLLRDWGPLVLHDPFCNPNLQIVDDQLSLRSTPYPAPEP